METDVKELMKPRIKVTNPFPLMKNDVGSLLERHEWNGTYTFGIKTNEAEHFYPVESFLKSPCFRVIQWWEDRQESDMPEYIRIIDEDAIVRVDSILSNVGFNFYHDGGIGYGKRVFSNNTVPATLEEYTQSKTPIPARGEK